MAQAYMVLCRPLRLCIPKRLASKKKPHHAVPPSSHKILEPIDTLCYDQVIYPEDAV